MRTLPGISTCVLLAAAACGSADDLDGKSERADSGAAADGASGRAGSSGTGASAGLDAAGTAGASGEAGGGGAGSGGDAGSGTAGTAGTSTSKPDGGMQPPGSICVGDADCSDAQGDAVCCAVPGCAGPCECRLAADCESAPGSVCNTSADCGDKVCCEATAGGQTMRICTPPMSCPGKILP